MSNFSSTDWPCTFKERRSCFINNASSIFFCDLSLSLLFLKWLPIILRSSCVTSTCSFSLLCFKTWFGISSTVIFDSFHYTSQYSHPNNFLNIRTCSNFVLSKLLNCFLWINIITLTLSWWRCMLSRNQSKKDLLTSWKS